MTNLLTPVAAAELLGISVKHLRTLTRLGHISYVNVGIGSKRESRRYEIRDLESFINRRKRTFRPTISKTRNHATAIFETGMVDFDATRERLRRAKRERK